MLGVYTTGFPQMWQADFPGGFQTGPFGSLWHLLLPGRGFLGGELLIWPTSKPMQPPVPPPFCACKEVVVLLHALSKSGGSGLQPRDHITRARIVRSMSVSWFHQGE